MRLAERAGAVAILLALALAPAGDALGQRASDPRLRLLERRVDDLQDRGRLLVQDRTALVRELAALQDELVTAAARLRDIELRLAAQAARRGSLEAGIAEAAAGREAQQGRLARLVVALERARRVPAEMLLLRETAPLDAARAARLLAGTLAALAAEARDLDADLAALDAARTTLATEDAALAAARAEFAAGHERLDEMIRRRGQLVAALDTERTALALRTGWLEREIAARRETIDRAVARQRAAAEAAAASQSGEQATAALSRPFDEARGRALHPVEGTILSRWGESEGNGRVRRGMTYAAAAQATIVAPWHGTIAYAGPFRGYGTILIVESGDGYHWFIAGLDRLDAIQGQMVLAGEPLGRAGAAGNQAAGDPAAGNAGPRIYVELRRNGQPIDPGPWLAAPNGRMSG